MTEPINMSRKDMTSLNNSYLKVYGTNFLYLNIDMDPEYKQMLLNHKI